MIGIFLGAALLIGAADKQPEGARVTAYESKTHEWTIIKTAMESGELQKKKYTVVCVAVKDVSEKFEDKWTFGPDACHLYVGESFPGGVVWELGNAEMIIHRGTHDRPIIQDQEFHINKIELLNLQP